MSTAKFLPFYMVKYPQLSAMEILPMTEAEFPPMSTVKFPLISALKCQSLFLWENFSKYPQPILLYWNIPSLSSGIIILVFPRRVNPSYASMYVIVSLNLCSCKKRKLSIAECIRMCIHIFFLLCDCPPIGSQMSQTCLSQKGHKRQAPTKW